MLFKVNSNFYAGCQSELLGFKSSRVHLENDDVALTNDDDEGCCSIIS